MLCYRFHPHCISTFRHSWGISEPRGKSELYAQNWQTQSSFLLSCFLCTLLMKYYTNIWFHKAPFCPENYKPTGILILIPPSRCPLNQLILIVRLWLNIYFFTVHVRVSTNVITVLHLLCILTRPWLGNDATITLHFSESMLGFGIFGTCVVMVDHN